MACTLDITAAIIVAFIKGYSPILIFRYIASAVFGKQAVATGWGIVAAGLLFHFLIALIWAIIFYALYPFIRKPIMSPVVAGLLYGVFVWLAMNLVVVPLGRIKQGPFTGTGVIREMAILMVCIGLPTAIITYPARGKKEQAKGNIDEIRFYFYTFNCLLKALLNWV